MADCIYHLPSVFLYKYRALFNFLFLALLRIHAIVKPFSSIFILSFQKNPACMFCKKKLYNLQNFYTFMIFAGFPPFSLFLKCLI